MASEPNKRIYSAASLTAFMFLGLVKNHLAAKLIHSI